VMGSLNVFIGTGVGGGGGGGADQAALASALQAGKISPVQGTETYPIDIQTTALVMQKYHTPEQFALDLKLLDSMAEQRAQSAKEDSARVKLTINDFVDIFEAVEKEQGYEAARHYATIGINYDRMTAIAKAFTDGSDTNVDNDPNIMPTRFMLLYGADDAKLMKIDKHPDNFAGAAEHKIAVTNLRKGLRLLGAKVAETGAYDDALWQAHTRYINRLAGSPTKNEITHIVEEGESIGMVARKYGLPSWKYLFDKNKDIVGDNPDLLKKGTRLEIPQWDSTSGDEKIAAKGADPSYYAHGSRYRYPWVPFSTTIVNEKGEVERKNKKMKYEIRDRECTNVLATGEIGNGDEIEALIPDSQGLELTIDGWPCDIEMKG
jgi:hypothetical protein